MLWKKRNEGTQVAVMVEEPVAAKPELVLAGDALREYNRVAKAIGWKPGALLEQNVRNFLAENGLCVFPYEKVEAYLDSKFGKFRGITVDSTWVWRPLRENDFGLERHAWVARRNGSIIEKGPYYHGPIPPPVMATVEKIAQAFPEVKFFVSDVPEPEDRFGDPFLALCGLGMKLLPVERWEEPSFRM